MLNIRALIIAALAATAVTAAMAEVRSTPRIDHRQENQEARIEAGVRSGELTHQEARKLREQQARIRAAERRAKNNGHISPAEKRRIEHMQDEASKDIDRLRHNNRMRAKKHHPHDGPHHDRHPHDGRTQGNSEHGKGPHNGHPHNLQ